MASTYSHQGQKLRYWASFETNLLTFSRSFRRVLPPTRSSLLPIPFSLFNFFLLYGDNWENNQNFFFFSQNISISISKLKCRALKVSEYHPYMSPFSPLLCILILCTPKDNVLGVPKGGWVFPTCSERQLAKWSTPSYPYISRMESSHWSNLVIGKTDSFHNNSKLQRKGKDSWKPFRGI